MSALGLAAQAAPEIKRQMSRMDACRERDVISGEPMERRCVEAIEFKRSLMPKVSSWNRFSSSIDPRVVQQEYPAWVVLVKQDSRVPVAVHP